MEMQKLTTTENMFWKETACSFFFLLSLCRVPLAQLHLDCFESKQRWNNKLIEGEELSFRQKPKGQTRARAQV